MASAAESDATWSGRRPAAAAAFLGGGDVGDAVGFFGYLFLCGSLGRDESESAAASAGFFLSCHYNLLTSEICHYNSPILKFDITIFRFFESCHFIRL